MFHHNVPTRTLAGVSFCTYTSDEIRKLSVLEITNPVAFDILGHATKYGLYDLRLGPSERSEICGTCQQPCTRCPGHLGHITLPLPVFNPLVIRTTFNLLRGTCLSCHHFRASPIACLLVSAQLKALSYGLVWTAKEMEKIVVEMVASENAKHSATVIGIETELNRLLKKALEGIDQETAKKEAHVKNVIECHHSIKKAFMRDHIAHAPKSCSNCGTSKRNLSLDNNTRVIVAPGARRVKVKVADKRIKKEVGSLDGSFGSFEGMANEKTETMLPEDDNEKPQKQVYLTPREAQVHLQQVYENNKELVMQLFGALVGNKCADESSPIDGFFIEVLPVPPSRFRPILRMGDMKYDNPHSTTLNRVIKDCMVLRYLLRAVKSKEDIEASENIQNLLTAVSGRTSHEKLTNAWFTLQSHVNSVFDSDMCKFSSDGVPGIKQILERKEGLFRKHMMGKRVNYAARSVISPDPYIDVDEIGIPEIFAMKLTYPQPVTPWNIKELRQAVINGPDAYPGAVLVKNQDGSVVMLGKNKNQREAIAKQLLTPSIHSKLHGCKIVYRHLRNGDILLLNRQPTLHKPSIMAHKARVLPGEKTLRLNYSNCKTYNADFDGDEMNAHFPQGELARSEAYAIANVNNQYLVPKDGTPLGGLIQDHIIAAVLLMIRGRFFNRSDYQQLVFGAQTRADVRIRTLPPSILRPYPLWSGKQVVSTLIINAIPAGKHLLSLYGKAKIALKSWQKELPRPWLAGGVPFQGLEMSESEVVIRNGELLCGILDKAHLGPTPYGLIHCCHELYGGEVSGTLLSQLGRLFTHFLRIEGFTLGIEDILVTGKADKKRHRLMRHGRKIGDKVACEALGLPMDSTDKDMLTTKLCEAHLGDDDRPMKELDMCMKVSTDHINNDINKACMPDGLLKQFPSNNLQLMVMSGAKGATVNCMQISCLLGQIELEGRRPPLMISGCSLPSFLPYDTSPRAGGFVDGRFLTGIRPQEYFFHCMAGREGLIDTAVKTSRSGYLQRCLIKHLEGLAVGYDLTVRDSDGSVIQFHYGEDALDIPKLQFLKKSQFPFLVENSEAVYDKQAVAKLLENCDYSAVLKYTKKVRKWLKNLPKREVMQTRSSGFLRYSEFHLPEIRMQFSGVNPKSQRDLAIEKLLEMWMQLEESEKKQFHKLASKTMEPVSSKYRPDVHLGAIPESLDHVITSYVEDGLNGKMSKSEFTKMMHSKILTSVCQPGEAVGLLAAQSIGEPSTQMTLNTFHFAGRGEMNVTLGIPRLREILMSASANIATPALEVPFRVVPKLAKKAERLRKKLSRVYLSEVLERVKLNEKLHIKPANKSRLYTLYFQFLPHKVYKKDLIVTPSKILHFMETIFFKHLISTIKGRIHLMTQSTLVSNVTMRGKEGLIAKTEEEAVADDDKDLNEKEKSPFKDDMEGDESSADEEGEEHDATSARHKVRHDQEREYEELDEEEKNLQGKGSDEENEGDDDNDKPSAEERSNTSSPVFWEDTKPVISEMEVSEDIQQISATSSTTNLVKELSVEVGQRKLNVIRIHNWITDYRFDVDKEEWCEITFTMDITTKEVDMNVLVKEEVNKAVVHHTQGIKKAFVIEQRNADGSASTVLKTEGVNVSEMYKYDDLLDLQCLYANDIHILARMYGIEAAGRAIVKEIQNVFRVYGIEVDPRHLLLIADYMTFEGTYKPFNRLGMESSASPLQQMSFETTMHFLKLATVSGISDPLKSPSSRLVVGKPVGCGTGSFDLIQPVKIKSKCK